jgi:anti-sigma B factor antagonist
MSSTLGMLSSDPDDGVGIETPSESLLADDGTATVTVRGEIDFSNSDEVAQAIRDAVVEWTPPVVRVDLKGATFIDSTGLGALIEGYRAASEIDCRFVVTNPTGGLRRVLTVTGLCELFGLGQPDEPIIGTSFSAATGV